MNTRKTTLSILAMVVIVAVIGSAGCALKAPPQLSPVGQAAWYGDHVLKAVDSLQQFAIDGEAAGALQRNDARAIVEATVTAGKAAQDLKAALAAGASESGAKAQAIAIIKTELQNLPARLSPEAQKVVAPYIQTVFVLLEVFA